MTKYIIFTLDCYESVYFGQYCRLECGLCGGKWKRGGRHGGGGGDERGAEGGEQIREDSWKGCP